MPGIFSGFAVVAAAKKWQNAEKICVNVTGSHKFVKN
jgi:hypothetical protein